MIVVGRMIKAAKMGAALACAVLTMATAAPALADEIADGAHRFVRTLADQAVRSLTSTSLSDADRHQTFRKLLVAHFDVPVIGKSVLGRHWRAATAEEQKEYLSLFEDLVVGTYAQRFREYNNQQLEITDVMRNDNDSAMVRSLFVRGTQRPIRIDWRVNHPGGNYKIVDVVVEGVSMVQTQRSEFGSIIVQNGGKLESLIDQLRHKTQSLAAQAN